MIIVFILILCFLLYIWHFKIIVHYTHSTTEVWYIKHKSPLTLLCTICYAKKLHYLIQSYKKGNFLENFEGHYFEKLGNEIANRTMRGSIWKYTVYKLILALKSFSVKMSKTELLNDWQVLNMEFSHGTKKMYL